MLVFLQHTEDVKETGGKLKFSRFCFLKEISYQKAGDKKKEGVKTTMRHILFLLFLFVSICNALNIGDNFGCRFTSSYDISASCDTDALDSEENLTIENNTCVDQELASGQVNSYLTRVDENGQMTEVRFFEVVGCDESEDAATYDVEDFPDCEYLYTDKLNGFLFAKCEEPNSVFLIEKIALVLGIVIPFAFFCIALCIAMIIVIITVILAIIVGCVFGCMVITAFCIALFEEDDENSEGERNRPYRNQYGINNIQNAVDSSLRIRPYAGYYDRRRHEIPQTKEKHNETEEESASASEFFSTSLDNTSSDTDDISENKKELDSESSDFCSHEL